MASTELAVRSSISSIGEIQQVAPAGNEQLF